MKCPHLVAVPLLAALLAPASGQLKIQAPDSLLKQFSGTHGIVYGTTATFGAPYYGERVLGRLVYGETKGRNHCTDEDYDLPSATPATGTDYDLTGQELVSVVLLRRGGCTFVTKVAVAEAKGAHAAVIVDKESSSMTAEQVQKIVMADDGYGRKVTIPSMLISRSEGQKLIDMAREGPVIVELAWDIPRGEAVLADFWMSSGSRETAEFLQRFRDSAEVLKYHLQFTLHFHIFSLPAPGSNPSNPLCISTIDSCEECRVAADKYCAPDPDGPGPITGGDVANEDLRRLCIWTSMAKKARSGSGVQYSKELWDYSVQFFRGCTQRARDQSRRFGASCSFSTMQKVGVPVDKVKECVRANYQVFLDEQVAQVAWSPQALRINGWRYSGPLDPETVLRAVCSSYTTVPKECQQLLAPYSSNYFAWGMMGSGFGTMLLFAILAAAVPGVIFALFYRKHITTSMRKVLREEIMLEVQSQMADYVPMDDNGHRGSPNPPALSF